ncbi:DUF3626 domain-containing protein [Paenibacillus yanchengensis]|uniref:DUF3626 domain-containing protein n=1 Tax=Paenibacillus yanchengensis TaxID=2035833 RepID=A0ABW4YPE7_9BACL
MKLTSSQQAAMNYINQYAASRKAAAQASITEILQMSNIPRSDYEESIEKLRLDARVALHFHPDRPLDRERNVAQALLQDGVYKSQFETKISNGSVSAYPGGVRDLWEKSLFGGAYHTEYIIESERPKYGALDIMAHSDGPSPRFGSCYFLLAPAVSHRCTYTYGGSQDDPLEKGTIEAFDDIIAAVLKESFLRENVLGENNLFPRQVLDRFTVLLKEPIAERMKRMPTKNLNYYIEAQVHGNISLQDDVEILVADPSFKGTDVGRTLEKLCEQYAIALHWHHGYSIHESEVPSYYRGPTMPSLAERIAVNHLIDAHTIGIAVNGLHNNPERWSDRGSYEEVLQELKLMWHVLVRFGETISAATTDDFTK